MEQLTRPANSPASWLDSFHSPLLAGVMLPVITMDTETYKSMCSRRDTFSRGALEQTLAVLKSVCSCKAVCIEETLAMPPIEKPERHVGGKTDFFIVRVSIETADAIIQELGTLEANAVIQDGQTTNLANQYGALLDLWLSYTD